MNRLQEIMRTGRITDESQSILQNEQIVEGLRLIEQRIQTEKTIVSGIARLIGRTHLGTVQRWIENDWRELRRG